MFNKFHLWFVPHHDNNHRAKLLRPGVLMVLVAFYLLNQSLLKSFAMIRPGVLGYSSEITIQKVLQQTNLQRADLGLPPLTYNSTLSQSATSKAQDMFTNNYWAHNSPSGQTPWDFFKSVNYHYSVAGENLARDFYDTDSLMNAWMKSPTHKANIINPKYREIGIGVVNGTLNGVTTTLVVQHFGTPLDGIVQEGNLFDSSLSQVPSKPSIIGVQHSSQVSPLAVTKTISILLFSLIIGVLIIDGYMALNNKTHRLTGSNAGHIGFLFIILLLVLFTHQGNIF